MLKLFQGSKKKAQSEFEELALPHLGLLYSSALRLTRNAKDAEDLVQETFLKAFRFFHRFEPGTNMKAWLLKIQMNAFINRHRRKVREREISQEMDLGATGVAWTSWEAEAQSTDPEASYVSKMLPDEVMEALDRLSEEFRTVVTLVDVEGLSYKEVAEIIERPVGTVMSRLYRGRQILKKLLRDYAVSQGIVKGSGATGPIRLDSYRRRRAG